MIAALSAALRALAAWLELKALSYLDDREDRLLQDIDRMAADLDRLRAAGDPHSQQRGDLLRPLIEDRQRQVESLRARRAQASRGSAGQDG